MLINFLDRVSTFLLSKLNFFISGNNLLTPRNKLCLITSSLIRIYGISLLNILTEVLLNYTNSLKGPSVPVYMMKNVKNLPNKI
jgi:hypothetical protein